jgi:hypothetical protein
MNINTVELTESGNYTVNKDADMISVPDNMDNRHRVMIQEWIDAGNTPTPYVEPVKSYSELRQQEYPPMSDQLDMLFWDKMNGTEIWKNNIIKIKEKFPKE